MNFVVNFCVIFFEIHENVRGNRQSEIHGTDQGCRHDASNQEQKDNKYTRVWMGRRDGPQIWVDQRGGAGPGSLPPTLVYHQ